eukprot:gene7718-9039_t
MTKAIECFKPLKNFSESLNSIHCACGDLNKQVITYCLCTVIDEDRRQCLLYDGDSSDAKLIGVEYIISEALFNSLPVDERKYWHSHKYEVESGLLALNFKSMVPNALENRSEMPLMKKLVNTYGKSWQLWPTDASGNCSSQVPMGPPQLLMAFTGIGQVRSQLVEARDKQMGINTDKKREERREIIGHNIAEGADHWTKGKAWNIYDQQNNSSYSNMNPATNVPINANMPMNPNVKQCDNLHTNANPAMNPNFKQGDNLHTNANPAMDPNFKHGDNLHTNPAMNPNFKQGDNLHTNPNPAMNTNPTMFTARPQQ